MYTSRVSSEYGSVVVELELEFGPVAVAGGAVDVVVCGSMGTCSADASDRFRCSRAHSSSHLIRVVVWLPDGGCDGVFLSRDALHLFSCFSLPHAQVIVTIAWHGVFSGHGDGA